MIGSQIILILALWLVAASVLGWIVPERWRVPALTACGLGLVGSLSPLSLALLLLGTGSSVALVRRRASPRVLTLFIIVIALTYGAFLVRAAGQQGWGLPAAALPLGMAYYVLRLVHYVLEADRDRLRAHGWQEVLAYQFFPAVLFVGPINRFDEFLRDLKRRRWDPELVSQGLGRLLFGAVKIVLIANYLLARKLAPMADFAPGSAGQIYADAILMWTSLYVQFSGYSDIAIGAGAVMGFRLPENFRWPFLAQNIGDFWRRWHITLSNWCRDYVHKPALARWRNPLLATTASMLVLGLWHEASIHYLLWGLYHALGLTIWRRFAAATAPVYARLSGTGQRSWDVTSGVLTIHFVIFSYPVVEALQSLIRSS